MAENPNLAILVTPFAGGVEFSILITMDGRASTVPFEFINEGVGEHIIPFHHNQWSDISDYKNEHICLITSEAHAPKGHFWQNLSFAEPFDREKILRRLRLIQTIAIGNYLFLSSDSKIYRGQDPPGIGYIIFVSFMRDPDGLHYWGNHIIEHYRLDAPDGIVRDPGQPRAIGHIYVGEQHIYTKHISNITPDEWQAIQDCDTSENYILNYIYDNF
ncbi:hypothetical protein L0F63_006397 [Massospora cicadina]|nr:hypothetical protein L0F63_006397 [Massospora cicadina]